MINGIFSPAASAMLWDVGLKALVLVIIIVCLVVLLSWLITEIIWRKKNATPAPAEDTEAEEAAEDTNENSEDTTDESVTETETETEEKD